MRYNFLIIFFILIVLCGCVSADWWDDTYNYRRNITLTGNTSGAQTDYQLLLNVTYDSDMQSDFDDLRFCNETHKLDAWLESKVDSSYALIWVEFPTTPANSVNQTYYMYYGNTGVASDWNGDATFLLFDGFEDGTVNKWSAVGGGGYTIDAAVKHSGSYSMKVDPPIAYDGCYASFSANTQVATSFWIYADISATVAYFSLYDSNNKAAEILFRETNYITARDGISLINKQAYSPTTWYHIDIVAKADTDTWDLMIDSVDRGTGMEFNVASISLNKMQFIVKDGTDAAHVDDILVRKYVANPPTYIFGSEENVIITYIPPDPINIDHTTGNFWVNHTWEAGTGNVTDSYNVSVNGVWHNSSLAYYNDTYTTHAWQNITAWAYNSTATGTLSLEYVNQDTQIPNNPVSITNTSDWTGDAGETVYVDYDVIDGDSDTPTFSCNRTDLFTNFNASTGKGNWTATANIYYVDFGVSDGYGSISNYTMTLRELSVEPPTVLDELNLIMSETTAGLKSVNMGDYIVYAFILVGILLIILVIQIIGNGIYRG